MSVIVNFRNSSCLKCDTINNWMYRIGVFVMCHECTKKEFKTDNPSKYERENYLKWLKVYNEKFN